MFCTFGIVRFISRSFLVPKTLPSNVLINVESCRPINAPRPSLATCSVESEFGQTSLKSNKLLDALQKLRTLRLFAVTSADHKEKSASHARAFVDLLGTSMLRYDSAHGPNGPVVASALLPLRPCPDFRA